MVIGAKPAIYLASLLYLLFIPLSLLPFSMGLKLNLVTGFFIAIAEAAIVFCVYSMQKGVNDQKSLKKARNISLVALFIGLVGLLVAAI
jgi:4-hydroxybenzoate polyprenyltransferase